MRYKRGIAVLLLAVMVLASGCKGKNLEVIWSQELGEDVLFKIEDRECTFATAKLLLITYKNLYEEVYGENVWLQQELSAEIENYLKGTVVSQLAKIETMCLLAEKRGVVLSGDEKKAVNAAAEAYIETLSPEEMKELDISEEEIKEFFLEYGLANKLYASLTADIDEEVSDDEARVMGVMCIVVESQETAQAVQERLAEGSDFQATANYYSVEEECNRYLYWRELTNEEKTALNKLEKGDISESIYIDGRYFIYKCVEKINRQLTEENKTVILKERAKVAFDDVYEEFKQTLKSKFNDAVWDSYVVDFSDNMVTVNLFKIYEEKCGFLNSGK